MSPLGKQASRVRTSLAKFAQSGTESISRPAPVQRFRVARRDASTFRAKWQSPQPYGSALRRLTHSVDAAAKRRDADLGAQPMDF